MEDLDNLFDNLQKESRLNSGRTAAEVIMENVESEFRAGPDSLSPEHLSRKKEREELTAQIKRLSSQLNKYKNVRNPRATRANKKRSEIRATIRKKIELCKLRLREIDMEEK